MRRADYLLWKSSAQKLEEWRRYYERRGGGIRNVARINDRVVRFEYFYPNEFVKGGESGGTDYARDVYIRPPSQRFISALRSKFADQMFTGTQAFEVYKGLNARAERGFGYSNMYFDLGRAVHYGELEKIAPGWYMFPEE